MRHWAPAGYFKTHIKNTHVFAVSAVKQTGMNLCMSASCSIQLRVTLAFPFCSLLNTLVMFRGRLNWNSRMLQKTEAKEKKQEVIWEERGYYYQGMARLFLQPNILSMVSMCSGMKLEVLTHSGINDISLWRCVGQEIGLHVTSLAILDRRKDWNTQTQNVETQKWLIFPSFTFDHSSLVSCSVFFLLVLVHII